MKAVSRADDADRLIIRESLDDTVIVEAAAGTGKTTELVWRLLNVLATGRASVEQVVVVTFTEKAAGELKLRIRQELEDLRQQSTASDVRSRIGDAIQRLEEAHISTIHGFCADLLRERPIEARIDPLFQVLNEPRAESLCDEAFRSWLNEQIESPPEGVRRALRRSVWSREGGNDDEGPIDRLGRAVQVLVEWRDFTGPWRREPFDRDRELQAVIGRIRDLAVLTDRPASKHDVLYVDTAPARELSHDIDAAERFGAADHDLWEARLVDLATNRSFERTRRGRDRAFGPGVTRDEVWAAYEATRTAIDSFRRAADADLAALLHDELGHVVARYEQVKKRIGALDFVDLLLRARDLLVEHASVRRAFQRRFTHIFVDEFQDTDPLQAEVLLLLAANDPDERDWRHVTPLPGKLFIVGDPKQAIYRFRRADVETYQEVCRLLVAKGAKRAYLHTSFRSTPALQRAVNAAFAPLMTGDRETIQAEYVSLSPYRKDGHRPSVVALPVPEPYGQRRVAAYAIEQSQPQAVGGFLQWLINESGWTVTERTTRDELPILVPVAARHVCVLFRRFTHYAKDVTRPYAEALEARGIPHVLVGGKSFHDREEVETVRVALAAVEWPDDELAVFATLRGALFAIGDEALLEYRHTHRVFHPYNVPEHVARELQPIVDALRLLRRLHGRRNHVPVADTITELLRVTRAHVGFVLRSGGEQALANVLHVAELARQYELNGGLSFRGFIEDLRDQAENGRTAEAPILEEGADGVRLMTVHKAKGLEFPVVILADLTAKLRSERADRLIDRRTNTCYLRLGGWTPVELATDEMREVARDEAEGVRVAYVAATRARDLLVIPAVGDVQWEGGWTAPLNAAVYPPPSARRSALAAPGCPGFKKDSVWKRPDNDPATPLTVCPGLHTISAPNVEPFQIVWWDPHVLELGVQPTLGIRREALIIKDVPEAVVSEGLQEYEQWLRTREEAVVKGSAPWLTVRTATEWASGESALAPSLKRWEPQPRQTGLFDVGVAETDVRDDTRAGDDGVLIVDARGPTSYGGARFGELVHAVLGVAPLDADADAVRAVADVQGRVLSAPENEISGAVETVQRILGHDLLARARAAAARGSCRRETPVSCVMPDGTLVEGVVDLAFEESGEWTVVDYKTDRELESSGEERYRRQLAVYLSAITRATGCPANGVLVRL